MIRSVRKKQFIGEFISQTIWQTFYVFYFKVRFSSTADSFRGVNMFMFMLYYDTRVLS